LEDDSLGIVITNPKQKILINPSNGGKVWSWKILKNDDELVASKVGLKGKGLCRDMFWLPKNGRWYKDEKEPYRVIGREIKGGYAKITLQRKLKSEGFEDILITKTFLVPKDRTSLFLHYKVSNFKKEPFSFCLWIHNHPILNEKLIGAQSMDSREVLNLIVPTQKGTIEVKGFPKYNLIFAGGGRKEGLWRENLEGNLSEGWVAEYSSLTKSALIFYFDLSSLLQVYQWRGNPPTIELMYQKITLLPRKSWETEWSISYLEKF